MPEYRWKDRGSYGRILHRTIKRLESKLDKETNHEKMMSLARTLAYLAGIQRTFIKDEIECNLERRISDLERKIHDNSKAP